MEVARLLLGTVVYRPYVYAFLACFLAFAIFHLGKRRTALFLALSYLTAFLCEYSSTRNGFPFGIYAYIDATRTRELWISNIPFWDSLSFVFLSYFSWVLAGILRSPAPCEAQLSGWATPILGGFLMVLLDVVIDPLSLRGDRWFLGQIYFYPQGGEYFGVTLANFAGWFFVGWCTQQGFQLLSALLPPPSSKRLPALFAWGIWGVYAGVFLFNLVITGWVAEPPLFVASGTVVFATLSITCWRLLDWQLLGGRML